MEHSTHELFADTAAALAQMYQRFTGWTEVRTFPSRYHDWWQTLPPQETATLINGVPIQSLIRQVHRDKGTTADSVIEAWKSVVLLVKSGRWPSCAEARPILEVGAPGLPLTVRDMPEHDVRGLLAQWLLAAHQGVHASTFYSCAEYASLKIEGKGELHISANSISWPGGHYLNRKGVARQPIDFNAWVAKPIVGVIKLAGPSAALMRKLQGVFEKSADAIQQVFVLAAIVGPECEAVLRAPFHIQYAVPMEPDPTEALELLRLQEIIRG